MIHRRSIPHVYIYSWWYFLRYLSRVRYPSFDHKYSAVVIILDLSIYAFYLSVCLVECASRCGKTFRTTSEEKRKTEQSISPARLTRWKLLLSKISRGELSREMERRDVEAARGEMHRMSIDLNAPKRRGQKCWIKTIVQSKLRCRILLHYINCTNRMIFVNRTCNIIKNVLVSAKSN